MHMDYSEILRSCAVRQKAFSDLITDREKSMIKPVFKGLPARSAKPQPNEAKCKCGRCTRSGEKSDSSMASSDLN